MVIADDYADANGVDVMTFRQAQDAARSPAATAVGSFTVAAAVAYYLKTRKAQGRNIASSEGKANAHIMPILGALECAKLTRDRLREWHHGIALTPLKASKEKDPAVAAKRRRSTANRVLTTLKAILNLCYKENKIDSDKAWRALEPFGDADSVRDRWLARDETQRLVNACGGDFRTLVKGALLTGARYGQLASAKVFHFNAEGGTLRLETRKGRNGKVKTYYAFLNAEAVKFFSGLCAGRGRDDFIFRNAGDPWSEGDQIRLINEACKNACLVPRITFHGLRHTYASLSLMAKPPLSLLILSRNFGHSDTKQVEKTYGHLAATHVREAIDASAPSFGFVPDTTVVPLYG